MKIYHLQALRKDRQAYERNIIVIEQMLSRGFYNFWRSVKNRYTIIVESSKQARHY